MRILIDAMGGDNAPGEIVRGAVGLRQVEQGNAVRLHRGGEGRACGVSFTWMWRLWAERRRSSLV